MSTVEEHSDLILVDPSVSETGHKGVCRIWVWGHLAKMESSGFPLGSCIDKF